MIPTEYIDSNKRLKWEFFLFERDGRTFPSPHLQQFIDAYPDASFNQAILAFLPYCVPVAFDSDRFTPPPSAWMKKNMRSAWTIWTFQNSGGPNDDGQSRHGPYYAFENVSDAVLFKLRWVNN